MNKIKFVKGLNKLAFAIVFALIGPFIIQQAFQNQNHRLYIYILVLGLIIAAFSIALGFLGISNLVSSLLDDSKNKTDS